MKVFTIFLVICPLLSTVLCAKILGVFPAPSHSHFTIGFRLMSELAKKGHEVVFINSHPQKTPIKNLRDVSTEEILTKVVENAPVIDLINFIEFSFLQQYDYFLSIGLELTNITFNAKPVKDLLNSNETFDLVILENFISESMVYFGHRFKCPIVMVAPGPTSFFNNYLFGNPVPFAYGSQTFSNYGQHMNFWQRFENTYKFVLADIYNYYRVIPEHDILLKNLFPDAPDLNTMLFNISMLLSVSHVSLDQPTPLQRNIKEVGPYYLSSKPLPKEFQDFMDNSPEGVIIFSMGSNLKSRYYDSETREILLKIFSKLKQKVLWKFEEDLPGKPDNVKLVKWLPQFDLLGHPNTVAFISHCGLLGITEAVYHGVPILALPVFSDQSRNAKNLEHRNMAIILNFKEIEEDSFSNALNELITNPKYKEAAKKASFLLRDNPREPMDEAIYWIEYVIRHKGAPHLRSAALDLRWYQLYLLDIILFVFVSFTLPFLIIVNAIRKEWKYLNSVHKKRQYKKNKIKQK